ncbi:MAG: hypothetical protein R3326_08190 [Gemmatimonadota bacterium]|nr:hypothetical protein [Gemmatimonadota bacterium]
MDRMIALIGATAGGWTGFGLGTLMSTLTGLAFAVVGTAAGVYLAGRLNV